MEVINTEYVDFCKIFAKKLLQVERFPEVIEVLTFLKSIEGIPPLDFSLVA